VHVWRLTRRAHQALDGEGARLYGGRWNSEGVAVVYASATLALAALEYLVHVDPQDVPDDLVALRVDVPDAAAAETVAVADLPADWNTLDDHPACVARGDAWAAVGTALALRVPSAIVPEEGNVLLNPAHPGMRLVRVAAARPFAFDPRLPR
jgi:RES domain-containing protein